MNTLKITTATALMALALTAQTATAEANTAKTTKAQTATAEANTAKTTKAQTTTAQKRAFLPPTMGWSSWNTFGLKINEDVICGQADEMVKLGLDKVGYQYINIDDGYWNGRGKDGNLIINSELFPHGMKYVADYIHSKGLKAGIYSDAGNNTCGSGGGRSAYGRNVGLAGHEYQDCKLYFNDWGYDFIKVDYCGGNDMGLDERQQYTKIAKAIKQCERETGRRIVFNVCRWAYPGTWVSSIADSWRTTGDIYDGWASYKGIIKENLYIQAYTGGGHYNDMDMLELGRSQTADEDRTHMVYWCITSSPLLIGCDMRKLTDESLALLKNTDLIAMNQDVLGIGAPVVQRQGDVYVVAKDMERLHGDKRAVVVMNLTDREQTIDVKIQPLGFAGKVTVHDCFTKADKEVGGPTMSVTIPAHGSQAYFFTGQRCDKQVYQAEEAWLHDYQELESRFSAEPREAASADQGVYVANLGNKATNYLEWPDVYVSKAGKYRLSIVYATSKDRDLTISVNGKTVKTVTCKNTGSWDAQWSVLPVTVSLHAGSNQVSLGNADNMAPNIDCMRVEAE